MFGIWFHKGKNMVKTTITLKPTTRDCLFRYCKKRKLTYDKGLLKLLGGTTEAPKEPMYSACPFCQEQFDINQVPTNFAKSLLVSAPS